MVEVLKALPGLIWSLLAAGFLFVCRKEITAAIDRVTTFEGFGIKVSLRDLEKALLARDSAAGMFGANAAIARERLRNERKRLDEAEILWVDDVPSGNRHEMHMFAALGARITVAANTEEAMRVIRHVAFHLIISDIHRGQSEQAGIEMLKELRRNQVVVPVVLYVGTAHLPAPAGASAIVDRPDGLVLAVLDALRFRA
jgi:CheY-like chemotaxis protein